MRPHRNSKEILSVTSSGRVSEDKDDSDDFEASETNFSCPKPIPKRTTLVPKHPKGNKENEPKLSKENNIHKIKIQEEANIAFLSAREAHRKRHTHCLSYSSRHIVHYLCNLTQGRQLPFWQDQSLYTPVLATVRQLGLYRTYTGFSRRATALAWHPTNPHLAAVGSKGGDIILWNFEKEGNVPKLFIEGQGPGGSIQALKFLDDGYGSCRAFTASMDGTLTSHNFLTGTRNLYLSTGYEDQWYTSLDVSVAGDVIVVGDNRGYVTLLSSDGEQLWRERLHKLKVTHIEFCPRMPWCLVTASVDRSLKVWDVRNMKTCDTCLHSHLHERPVNSAHFSRTDGSRLVTTDQHSEIRVYSCPSFTHSLTIPHPHRQFQHLTPIKATWHPLRDIIVVGRYPDPSFYKNPSVHDHTTIDAPGTIAKEVRTIDMFDGVTGRLLHQLSDPGCSNKIISLNLFGNSGDTLLSTAGMCVWVWKPKFELEGLRRFRKTQSELGYDNNNDDDNNNSNMKRRKRNVPGQMCRNTTLKFVCSSNGHERWEYL